MLGGPLVEDFGCKVHPAGPGNRADLGIHSDLRKECGIVRGSEYAFPLGQMGQVDITHQAVREREPQPVVAEHFDVADIAEQSAHALSLRQRWNRGRHLMRGHLRPVGEQLLLVKCRPLEHLAQHTWRQRAHWAERRTAAGNQQITDTP
jgi:hypothetical protein